MIDRFIMNFVFWLVVLFASGVICNDNAEDANATTDAVRSADSTDAPLSQEEVRGDTDDQKSKNDRENRVEMTTAVAETEQRGSNETQEIDGDVEERTDVSSEQDPSTETFDRPEVVHSNPQWPPQFYPRYEVEYPFITKLHPSLPYQILSCRPGFFLYSDLCVRSLYFS